MKRIQQLAGVVTAIGLTGAFIHAEAQRRVPGEAPAKQAIQTTLKVGSQVYQSNEPGRCTYAPVAAIYQVVSQMWSVQQMTEGRSLALTLWRPKDGSADMVTLSITIGNASHDVNTVRGGGPVQGAAKVAFEKSGTGGTFTVDGRAKDGTAITGTIKCDAFAPHTAEGGL